MLLHHIVGVLLPLPEIWIYFGEVGSQNHRNSYTGKVCATLAIMILQKCTYISPLLVNRFYIPYLLLYIFIIN